MSRIADLNRRYAAAASVALNGVEIIAVGDPAGARLNAVVRRLLLAVRDDGPGLWEDLLGATKALRWRLITQPRPARYNPVLIEMCEQVGRQVNRLRGAVGDEALLNELTAAAQAVTEAVSPLGVVLVRFIEKAGPSECVVVATSKPAQIALATWLCDLGTPVLTAGELEREQPDVGQALVVGPPRFYRSSLVTAPVTSMVKFFLPAWFGDRSIPRSPIAAYADGAIRVKATVSIEGDTREPVDTDGPDEVEEDFLPQPSWSGRKSSDRLPRADEVAARKVLLSGNLAIYLDDGDRIRALDPEQPPGERVVYTEVNAVRPGTYLLLRQGETERGALYRTALALLPANGSAVDAAQKAWKNALARRLELISYPEAVRELRARGVRTADRVRAWTDPALMRPNRDEDFYALLSWLDIPIQPTFGLATMLRRAHHQASANLRDQLEKAVSEADLSAMERDGHWRLDMGREGVRGLIATRVLATSPHTEIVLRHDARVPFRDRSGQWLE
ncbi:hypothetical protein [Micromonospora coxensis]|uniref:Uncharacterized protein n=1 Tax=Micromonospora coxensis TaxID=356852 RepID=A0A1C5GXF1_9ACTN|nr:hypothetical protein [Micromonospora coxensis]SCG38428.1 hypothetical protein GA0070614_0516 [Micromonospora coxensis]